MIERKTLIDQIEMRRDGTIGIRFAKLIVEGERELSCSWHRTVIEPGADVDAQIALVNTHLVEHMGEAKIDDSLMAELKKAVALMHTPERVKQHAAKTAEAAKLVAK